MTYSLADVLAPLTTAEVETSIYGVLDAVGVKTSAWKPGSVARAIVTGCSAVIAAFSTLTTNVAKMGWLEFTSGDWLTFTALYDYGTTRRPATFATGSVTINNTGGGVYDFDIGDMVVVNTAAGAGYGKTYRNTAAVNIGALETGVSATVEAIEAGSDSTAAPGQIDAFETTYLGLTVSNPLALVGLDEETDAELKIRCQEAAIAVSPDGPRDAYSFFAKKATRGDGSDIGITRVQATTDSETGDVVVTVATASGALSGADLNAAELYLNQYAVPLGVTLDVVNGVDHVVPVTYTVYFRSASGITATEVETAVAAALADYFAARPIGGDVIPELSSTGYVRISSLAAAICAGRSEIFHVVLTAPSSDHAMASNDIPVLGTITATCTPVTS